ncbi:hypothetical protein [Poriferisphaera sp. WC338]|uniref:hypothetical protein n=1 Tax=Poriferisphaera sp. WC338 TaxID=3425129 RepID=UPI003D815CBB
MPAKQGTIRQLKIPLPAGFKLQSAVCFYGFFVLAPNHWLPDKNTLLRPLRIGGEIIQTTVTQQRRTLIIDLAPAINPADQDIVYAQVRRMLRLDESFSTWWDIHPQAKTRRFGPMFRSPTLFEDIIKTFTTCNVTWPNTKRMNELLVKHIGGGAFPTPEQLAAVTEGELKAMAKVGYRAQRMIKLAEDTLSGTLNLHTLEYGDLPPDELFKQLRSIHGLGPYGASNLCQLLGSYQRIPIDTETHRHFCQKMNLKRAKDSKQIKKLDAKIEKHYARWAPYQFLAYWFDLWLGYEDHLDKPSEDWAHEETSVFTASEMK